MKPLTPQELSIGNLLNYDTGEGIELTVIDWHDLKWLQEEPDLFNNWYTPVPLTPEILEGFGFEACGDKEFKTGYELKIKGFLISYWFDKNFPDFDKLVWDNGGVYDLKYTHRLQNFIHAISGVELVYKPNNTK